MTGAFQVTGTSQKALFTLKLHRGDGMSLVAMNWKKGTPPRDFVGFAIEYKEPGGDRFFALKNRLCFPFADGSVNPNKLSTRLSPIQKFRWIHFPRNAELAGEFTYNVSPVFMNAKGELSYGEPQEAAIELRRETYPGKLNVAFTRGFVSSQAFVDKYGAASIPTLLPANADGGLDFVPTFAKAAEALAWMGFEARSAIIELLDQAIADPGAQVRAVVYDLNEPGMVSRYTKLGSRLKIIIDDDGAHGKPTSGETVSARRLAAAGVQVKRQHMGKLQHNKFIVVDGPTVQVAVAGSTNHSWRGFFVQNNNAMILRGPKVAKIFMDAFDQYSAHDDVAGFAKTGSAVWNDLQLAGIDGQIGFSPRSKKNAVLKSVADDLGSAESSVLFSLAFLSITPGPVVEAIKKLKQDDAVFSYGIADKVVKGLNGKSATGVSLQQPDGKVTLVRPEALTRDVPAPFKKEPTGGGGTRMHHKFIVIDFDKPTARVYLGSFNFSASADTSNGENLLLFKDRRIATSYAVEALRIFDHYQFRVAQAEAKEAHKPLQLQPAPATNSEKPWWQEDYTNARKILDRKLFA